MRQIVIAVLVLAGCAAPAPVTDAGSPDAQPVGAPIVPIDAWQPEVWVSCTSCFVAEDGGCRDAGGYCHECTATCDAMGTPPVYEWNPDTSTRWSCESGAPMACRRRVGG